jgi:DNA-binding transcriptional LysR family regulator
LDLALLRTFLTVHRAGSFTRAAQLLGVSQPAVTGQIRTLERQLGRPLFQRLPRGVESTSVAVELAGRVAPHLDALAEITESSPDEDPHRTLHLAAPPEFTASHLLPALAPLIAQGLGLRISNQHGDTALAGLASAAYDLVISTRRPRAQIFRATPLLDEEYVLVAAGPWVRLLPSGAGAASADGEPADPRPPDSADPAPAPADPTLTALDRIPLIDCDERLPFATRYWHTVFDRRPARPASVVAPDLTGVLSAVLSGAGMAVLPRRMCQEAITAGRLRPLIEPPLSPLRTYFLVVRAGSLVQPAISRTHGRLLSAATDW